MPNMYLLQAPLPNMELYHFFGLGSTTDLNKSHIGRLLEEDNSDKENDQITYHLRTPYYITLSISDDRSGIEKTD